MEYLLKQAQDGDLNAMFSLGVRYFDMADEAGENSREEEENYGKAFIWFKKAAEKGLLKAQCNTAWCYQTGTGTMKDMKLAFYWYSKASEQEESEFAQYNLACCYMNGEGTKTDEDKAFIYWKKSAKSGYAPSQKNLGICYLEGIGTKKSREKGIEWLTLASEQDDEEAREILESLKEKK